jgi:hypothetical protein
MELLSSCSIAGLYDALLGIIAAKPISNHASVGCSSINILFSSETSSIFLFLDLERDADFAFLIALIPHQDIKSAGINSFIIEVLLNLAILDGLSFHLLVEFSILPQSFFVLFKCINPLSILIVQ